MLIVYCEKCGKRVPPKELEALGLTSVQAGETIFCGSCKAAGATATVPLPSALPSLPDAPSETVTLPVPASPGSTAPLPMPKHSGRLPAPSPSAGIPQSGAQRVPPTAEVRPVSATTVARRTVDAPPRSARSRVLTPVDTRRNDAENEKKKTGVIVGVGVGVVAALVLAFFALSGGDKKNENASSETSSSGGSSGSSKPAPKLETPPAPPAPPAYPAQKTKQPSTPTPPSTVPTPPATPPAPAPVPAPPPPEAPVVPAPPPQQAPTPAPAGDLASINDVESLRNALLKLGANAPHDQVRRLSQMPPPVIDETVAYSIDFTKGNLDSWRSIDDKPVSLNKDQGENALKAMEPAEPFGAYRNMNFSFNHTRIKLRLYQVGLKSMRLDCQTHMGLRFRPSIPLPKEGEWSDVEVDCSSFANGDVKMNNIANSHIEVQGFHKTPGGYFLISKFEVIIGGK